MRIQKSFLPQAIATYDPTLQQIFLQLTTISLHHLYDENVCDGITHSTADFKIPTSVLIDIHFYILFNCRYIGHNDYADILGYLILQNPLNDLWQISQLSITITTCSPLHDIFSTPYTTSYYLLFITYLSRTYILSLFFYWRSGKVLSYI